MMRGMAIVTGPTRYFVEYEDSALYEQEKTERGESAVDPANYICEEDFDDLDRARAFMREKQQTSYAAIYERTDIYDTTPDELAARGVRWYSASFDEQLIED